MAKLSKRKELLKLIQAVKKKGFLTYQEINEAIPEEIVESDDLDSVMSLIEENNIEIVESEKKWKL
ncbi:MAG: RNA polymerase sigma factor region1.1 domain-containing protein, partial [Bdellovibrionales bacterium]|nr:RNA polymerase sigma factor region1.1 domain-containing protein [Bdellovibrionales bacterium]